MNRKNQKNPEKPLSERLKCDTMGPDFTDPDLAEAIYRFISQTERLGDVRRKQLSMLEYVTIVCPHEFKEWLTSEDGAPDSGAVDQLSSR